MYHLKLFLFALGTAAVVYALNCLVAKRLKPINIRLALAYFSTLALIGLFGEIFLDTVYSTIVGHPLWYYNIEPIHGGYTSSYAAIIWGIYGLHLYLLHDSLATKWSITRLRHLTVIFSLEALVFEAILTLSAKLVFGKYLYYYTPGDLWHVTTIQNMPFYFICGVITFKTLKRARRDPLFFTFMSAFLLVVLVFMT